MTRVPADLPLALRHTHPLRADPPPDEAVRYDAALGFWIDARTQRPLVLNRATAGTSNFGETTLTETGEGTDQREITASAFGETTNSRSMEGTDQTEVAMFSTFGETTKTATGEGTDQNEISEGFELLG